MTPKTSVELAENFLKNNIFQFKEKTLKQLRGRAIHTKFPHHMQFYLWLTLRKEFQKALNCSHVYGRGKQVAETFNAFHPTIKFTMKWSRE